MTLHVGGSLRGCIGVIEAKGAAGREHRADARRRRRWKIHGSARCNREELPGWKLRFRCCPRCNEFSPKTLKSGSTDCWWNKESGAVCCCRKWPWNTIWEREQFLKETCHKAGLSLDAWKEADTRIYGFTCEIVEEERAASGVNGRESVRGKKKPAPERQTRARNSKLG